MSVRGERWERSERDRYPYERERDRYEDDKYYMRGGRGRDHAEEPFDRTRFNKSYDDDYIQDRRYYDEEARYPQRRERQPEPEREREPFYERDPRRPPVMEKERERDPYAEPPPRARPTFLRRQSSLDTFDRRPMRNFYEREEYPAPARREDIYRDDYRPQPYVPAPLPKSRQLGPPRRHGERYYDDIDVAEPDRYGDDEYRSAHGRTHEKELVRSRKRRDSAGSHTTKSHTHRSSSRTSTTTSRSSSSSGGTTIRSEYPKKGKTRIPARLVSKRALIALEYPFHEEGNTIIVQKALGQDNIDELLRLSEEYKQSELEILAARSSAAEIDDRREVFVPPPVAALPAPAPAPAPTVISAPPPPAPAPAPIVVPAPAPAPSPIIIDAAPPRTEEEVIQKTVIREISPARTVTTSSSYDNDHVALVSRSRSRSRSGREIRAEIRALERELAHRPKGGLAEREITRTERLPDGQVVIYQESVEKVVAGPKPPRIEKDKKGPPPKLMRAMLATLS